MTDPVTLRSQSRRSWERITSASPTDRFIAVCKPCTLPIAVESATHTGDAMTVDCPECTLPVRLERVYGTITMDTCDGSCVSATGRLCGCGCGGKNHGKAFAVGVVASGTIGAGRVAAIVAERASAQRTVAVAKYRATSAKRAETARVKRERKEEARLEALAAAIEAFHADHAEIIDAMYECRDANGVLSDMLDRFGREGYLSPRTLDYAASLVARARAQREREAREAAKIAERAARGVAPRYAGNTGDKITVEGVVTVTYRTESDFGPKMMIIVEGTGAHEGVTIKWSGTAAVIWTLNRGDVVTIIGKVKDHSEYQGTPQTVLTYCKVTVHDGESATETAETAPVQATTPAAPESAPTAVVHAAQAWSDARGQGTECGKSVASAVRSWDPTDVTCPDCKRLLTVTAMGRPVPKGATANPSYFPAVWLRDGEVIEAAYPRGGVNGKPRRCRHGHGFRMSEPCYKEVVQVRVYWSDDMERTVTTGRRNSAHWFDVWRHLDGTPGHPDAGTMAYDCQPVHQCSECGSEDDAHCPQCHADGARVYRQEAWGDRFTCTSCDRNDFHSIGD